MKKRIFYMLLMACCLGTYSSAKQVYKSAAVRCDEGKEAKKKAPAKAKKVKAATIRPFNFYLINI